MVWSTSSLSTESINASQAGLPFIVAENHTAGTNASWVWQDGSANPDTSSDWTHPDWPTSNIYNNIPYTGSMCEDRNVQTYYLYGDLGAVNSVYFDTVYLQILWAETNLDVQVDVSNNADMSGSTTVHASVNHTTPSRILDINLNNWTQYSTGQYMRLTFTNAVGDTKPPVIGEIRLGRRRQFGKTFSSPWDDEPDESTVAEWESRGRAIFRYTLAEGFHNYSGTMRAGEAMNAYGFSDDVTIRTIFQDCTYGRNPVLFVYDGNAFDSGYPHEAYFGYLDSKLNIPRTGVFEKNWEMNFTETAPFYSSQVG
jgi:hypothetical protein